MTQNIEYHAPLGVHIEACAQAVVTLAKKKGNVVSMKFNGVFLRAAPDTTADTLIRTYHQTLAYQSAQYAASPEGKTEAAARKARDAREEAEAVILMAELGTLDFTALTAVLHWLYQIQSYSDRGQTAGHTDRILRLFAEHGYQPSVNCGEAFDATDRDNEGRYLIGQALAGLESIGAVHPIFVCWVEDFREKWGIPVPLN